MNKNITINSNVLANNTITIQPSTINGLLTIISSYEMETIEVTNKNAQLILKKSCAHKTEQIQLPYFLEDIYFVRVLYSGGMSVTKKVFVNI
jgi:hypothetical protein